MMGVVSDLDVLRSAKIWCDLHGDAAEDRAWEMLQQMQRNGDDAGAQVWMRIISDVVHLRSGARA